MYLLSLFRFLALAGLFPGVLRRSEAEYGGEALPDSLSHAGMLIFLG